MSKYKVLWFDDEFATMEIVNQIAMSHEIELIGYANAVDGIKELSNNYWSYDAVLLDGNFLLNPEAEMDGLNDEAFGIVAMKLNQLKVKGVVVPSFIYSGQLNFLKEKNKYVNLFKEDFFNGGKIFDKNKDQDFIDLCSEIKKAADTIELSKLRRQYADVFEVCTEKYIGDQTARDILSLLVEKTVLDRDNYFNLVRKVLEDIFKALNKNRLLPSDFILPNLAFNETADFLSGESKKGYTLKGDAIISKIIIDHIQNILAITQPGSHRSHIDEYLNFTSSNYLLKSVVYDLMDVITWLKHYIDSEPKKKNWTKHDDNGVIHSGIIERDDSGNYYCGGFALNPNYVAMHFKIGDKIEITEQSTNNNYRTKFKYNLYAVKFKKS